MENNHHGNNVNELCRLLNKYNLPQNKHYGYGTAGFRYFENELPPIVLRVGIAIGLGIITTTNVGSRSTTSASPIIHMGIMVTASHNTEEYNGIKIASWPDGGMLPTELESPLTKIVNMSNNSKLLQMVTTTAKQKQTAGSTQLLLHVHIGHDTRSHGPTLANLLLLGLRQTNPSVKVHEYGVVTTPQLHHIVKHANGLYNLTQGSRLPKYIPLRIGLPGYYELLVQSYLGLLATKTTRIDFDDGPKQQRRHNTLLLVVDCACGVGYPHLQILVETIGLGCSMTGSMISNTTKIVPCNGPNSDGQLNVDCGSEHIQKTNKICKFYEPLPQDSLNYCASLDGDADRIVFFSANNNGNASDKNASSSLLLLMDGDKMSCLIAQFLQEQIELVVMTADGLPQQQQQQQQPKVPKLRLGVVQTGYANGNSTRYLENHNIAYKIAKTGVKHVHQMAHDNFDVGIYFESNGHGTILFNDAYFEFLDHHLHDNNSSSLSSVEAKLALTRLKLLPSLVNQAVGDALSDLLLIDAILQLKNMDMNDWDASLYQNLPTCQSKVVVPDRNLFVTADDDETICIKPNGLQNALDSIVSKFDENNANARAFVRPSGTENVVRIYAEASTQKQAESLAEQTIALVKTYSSGDQQQTKSHL